MSYDFKPMKAENYGSVANIRFPVLGSPKLDGCRATCIHDMGLVTTSLAPVANDFIRNQFSKPGLEGVDGELIVGDACSATAFNTTTGAFRRKSGEPKATWHVFDTLKIGRGTPFNQRLTYLKHQVDGIPNIKVVPHTWILDVEQLDHFEASMLKLGYEGVMLRDPDGVYKFGRSTVKEGLLLKVKRFTDIDVIVVGFEELTSNQNELQVDARGYAKRSTNQAGLIYANTLGALIVTSSKFKTPFNVGTGFTAAERAWIWSHQTEVMGQLGKVKYQECGTMEKPRIPTWLGFRSPLDT